ncbi:hypothetical protein CVT91_11395 [Candidatus Atribacteria bacterium HGW-Atribacteria-1]|nr:MAG: hypothetical protein CVT91_11395 [Candidatus Atribacteria bacterium HGW-Atribacteria-1]
MVNCGDEIFQRAGSEELSDVKTQKCFGALIYWFKNNMGLKLNLSYANRRNYYTKRGIGCGLVYKF